ncbi:putative legume lectin, alpha chain, concanavalin A-like lectin/glucanase domain superfamily [Helianthus debilis subsp. tardiflorus]
MLIWSYGAGSTTLSYHVDLLEVVPEWVTVGFSAATGTHIERHVLQYSVFNSRFSTEDEKEISNKWKLTVGLTLPLDLIIIGGIITCTRFCIRRPTTTQESLDVFINDDLQGEHILIANSFWLPTTFLMTRSWAREDSVLFTRANFLVKPWPLLSKKIHRVLNKERKNTRLR